MTRGSKSDGPTDKGTIVTTELIVNAEQPVTVYAYTIEGIQKADVTTFNVATFGTKLAGVRCCTRVANTACCIVIELRVGEVVTTATFIFNKVDAVLTSKNWLIFVCWSPTRANELDFQVAIPGVLDVNRNICNEVIDTNSTGQRYANDVVGNTTWIGA